MQRVLVIDLTGDIAAALVVDVSSPELRLVERQTAERRDYIHRLSPPESVEAVSPPEDPPSPRRNLIQELVAGLSADWTNSVVLLPPVDYISVSLKTPFADPRRLEQVLSLEVQDAIPFELDEMHMQYRLHNNPSSAGHEVHVSLMPKKFLRALIEDCRGAGVEATVVSTLSSLLDLALPDGDATASDAALVYWSPPFLSLGILHRGGIWSDRVTECYDGDPLPGLRDVRTALLAFEQRNESQLNDIYVVGEPLDESVLREAFPGRDIHAAPLSNHEELARRAALFGRDTGAKIPLVNFRSGNLCVRLRWAELFKGARELLPYALLSVLCLIVALGVLYYSRLSRLHHIQESMIGKIAEVLPSIDSHTERPSDFVRNEISIIQRQLRDLGSPFQLSPLDELLDVGRDIQRKGGVTVSRVMILGNKVTVEGTTQDYKATDTIEDNFQKKRKTYCDVKKDVTPLGGTGTAGAARFTLRLELCE